MVKIFIRNFGCCANQNNGELMAGILKKEGHRLVDSMKQSDIVIVNTCIVKQITESKVRYSIGEAIKLKKKVIIAGCMPEGEYEICREIAPEASLLNTFHITDIGRAVNSIVKGNRAEFIGKRKEVKNLLPIERKKKNTANIQISEGCLNACSFCIVKKAKGQLRSFPKKKIVDDVKKAVEEGCTEINITSQDNSAYGLDRGKQELILLLKQILKIEGDFNLRIGMMNPEYVLPILDGLVDIYKNPKVKKFIHIPIQSGSDKVLREMNRNYKVKDFKKIVKTFRKQINGITISTDLIAGYPTESEKDFEKTMKFMKKIKPDVINISRFGSRPGTLASRLKQLPSEEVKERSRILSQLLQVLRNQG